MCKLPSRTVEDFFNVRELCQTIGLGSSAYFNQTLMDMNLITETDNIF